MNLLFWVKKNKAGEIASGLVQLGDQLNHTGEQLNHLIGQMAGMGDQSAEIGLNINKLSRIQYKTGQEILGKLDRLAAGMDVTQRWQADYTVDTARLATIEKQVEYLTGVLIGQLDDIDLACAGLQGEVRETWRQLLIQWGNRLLVALNEIGVYELNVLGRTFDPQWAESICAVERDQPAGDGESALRQVPYEVVEVVKRGFVNSGGLLLRKAQVITVREGCLDEQQKR